MKRAKPFLVGHAGAEKSRNAARRHRVRIGKKRPLPEGFYGNFGGVNAQEFPPIDAMLMPTLSAALGPLPEAICEAFLQRGLLPASVSNGLFMARFLSIALLPARAAQECLGVRASILLADANLILGDWPDKYVGDSNDIFKTGQRFSSITDAFGMRASWMKRNRKFRAVMRSMSDPAECLKQLGRCKLWDEMGRRDRVYTITNYGLQECDVLPGDAGSANGRARA